MGNGGRRYGVLRVELVEVASALPMIPSVHCRNIADQFGKTIVGTMMWHRALGHRGSVGFCMRGKQGDSEPATEAKTGK